MSVTPFKRAFAILVFIVAFASPVCVDAASDPPPDAKIKIESRTLKHMGEALSGASGEPLVLEGDLKFPIQARERYPAIVILHTIGSYRESNEGWAAERYRQAGFATLTYESIKTRGIDDAPTKGARILWGSLVADGFGALKSLAAHPRIDPRRIAVTGYSMGAEVTRLLAFEALRRKFVDGDLRYAAHVAVYPCHVWAAEPVDGSFTGAPILEQLGEKDDCGPPAKAKALADAYRAKKIAAPVTVTVYAGAYHSWSDPHFPTARYFPNHASPSKCPLLILRPGYGLLYPDGNVRPFDNGEMGTCFKASRGYYQGFDSEIRAKSLADSLAFLANAFQR